MDNIIRVIKTITWLLLSRLQGTWLLLSRLQGNKPHRNSPEPDPCLRNLQTRAGTLRNPPEPSEPCLRNLRQRAGTLRTLVNLPRPSGTNLSEPFGTYYLGNLRQHTPEPSEIFRNFPGTCLRNSYHFTPELSGTFRDLPPEPTPAYAGTLRNLPETAFGTYTSTRQNSPEPSGTFLRNLLLRPAPAHTGTYLG